MKAVILAAGYATRLRPYTLRFPKTLLRIAGRPLLDDTLTRVARAPAVDGVYIVTNDLLHHAFLQWRQRSTALATVDCPVEIVNDQTSTNESRLGSIGDLLYVVDQAQLDEDLLVICSDKVFTFDISALCRYAALSGGVVNTYRDVGDPALLARRFGCLTLDKDRRVLEFQEKPEVPASSCKSIAFYIYPREVIELIRGYVGAGDNPDAPGYLSQWLCRRTPMFGWPIDGDCLDVGDPASYREANRICWEAAGEQFQEVRLFVEASGRSDEGIGSSLRAFSEDPRVTMISVAVERQREQALIGFLTENRCPVPVNVVARSGKNPAEQASDVDANLGVILRGAATVDLAGTAPAAPGEAIPIIES